MKVHDAEQRTKEINKTIAKLKKLFKIKENCFLIEKRLNEVIADKANRVNSELLNNKFEDDFYNKLIDIEYSLDLFSTQYKTLTPFKLYKIFKMCLRAINEKEYFMDTIGSIKEYDHRKIIKKIEEVRKFIPTLQDEQIREPYNPNASYNEIFFYFIDILKISIDDTKELLGVVYGYSKKAKLPIDVRKELLKQIDIWKLTQRAFSSGQTANELEAKLKSIDKQYERYL